MIEKETVLEMFFSNTKFDSNKWRVFKLPEGLTPQTASQKATSDIWTLLVDRQCYVITQGGYDGEEIL